MRLVHYLSKMNFEAGGPVRAVLDLTSALAKAGHHVTILTTIPDDIPQAWRATTDRQPGLPHVAVLPPLHGPLKRLNGQAIQTAEQVIREADLVHLHGVWETSNVQIFKAARRLGKPHAVSLRGMLDDWPMSQKRLKKVAFLRIVGYDLLNSAAFIHCTAFGELAQSRKWFSSRAVVIPNFMELSVYAKLPGESLAKKEWPFLDHAGPTVLFLSRVNYKKGVEIFIDMAKRMIDAGSTARFAIAGSGEFPAYVKKVQDYATSLGLDERLKFLGMVRSPLKESLYQHCDLFVLPTSQENFGFVFYESLACETPLLTTYFVDTWPELKGSSAAEIAEPRAEEFADHALRMLEDREALAQRGRRGREWVLDNLDPVKVLDQFVRAYQTAIARPARKPAG